jgi:hypothetical protein
MLNKILCAVALCSLLAVAACGSAPDNRAMPGGVATATGPGGPPADGMGGPH